MRKQFACITHVCHAFHMAALQLRDVPEDVHHELKLRAAKAGQSLSEYALAVLKAHTATPTYAEIAERIAQRSAVEPTTSVAELIRAERDARSA
jgi:antitoxin FitA